MLLDALDMGHLFDIGHLFSCFNTSILFTLSNWDLVFIDLVFIDLLVVTRAWCNNITAERERANTIPKVSRCKFVASILPQWEKYWAQLHQTGPMFNVTLQ
jgi:hypothetical protein